MHPLMTLANPQSYYQRRHRERQAGKLSELPLCPNCHKRRIIPREGHEPKKICVEGNQAPVPVCYTCWLHSSDGTAYLNQKQQESRDRRKQARKEKASQQQQHSESLRSPSPPSPSIVVLPTPSPSAPVPILVKSLAPLCLEALDRFQSELRHKNSSSNEEVSWKWETLYRLKGQLEIMLPLLNCSLSVSDISEVESSVNSENEPRSLKLKRVQLKQFNDNLQTLIASQ